ncbi:MAG: response regulator [Methyloversatilis sp.]|uniref:hybrid sensor histidine kinase/response regulator n=1 Tax=Methyloversatilis sp. TaxID=2569862 RepID=UPI0027360579|nr:response regulator [Methyloversatilis sp.]MDP3873898.1 response regulator [Methyloversatilis sp.]
MATKNEALLQRLLATFRVEADEHIKAMASGLLALEKMAPGQEAAAVIETVFREAHSLKGASRAVNLLSVESLCQALESVLAGLKNGRLAVSLPLLDLLLRAIGALGEQLADGAAASPAVKPAHAALIRQLDRSASGLLPPAGVAGTPVDAPLPPPAHAPQAVLPEAGAGSVRIATAKLDAVMRQVEELLSPRLAARQRALELGEAAATVAAWKKTRLQVQPALRRIERAALRANGAAPANGGKEVQKVLEYLDGEHRFIATLEDRLRRLNKSAARDQRALAGMTDGLLDDVREMQLLPFASLFDLLPRLARDLAREQGKEVELVLRGGDIELDRRILENLKDPLIHLLRNAIDHGIETPAARRAGGKPALGTVTLAVSQPDSGKIELVVGDDGAGIDGPQVAAAARKLGLAVDCDVETLSLVFQSGLSTSPIITDVSGRGLGLAIVREKVERLGGSVAIESKPCAGTLFRLVLPMALATFRGVLVRVGEYLCAIPAVGIERVARVASQDIRTVENRDAVLMGDRLVSLVSLGDVLEMPPTAANDKRPVRPVVVLGRDEARVAFRVDEIVGEQEILVKPLGPQLARVRNVAGASMLGTGQVVPVLNVADLLKSAARDIAPRRAAAPVELAPGTKRSVLVAEDSITSRSLLKNILESAGYAVTTAVDGMDAYTTLRSAHFDVLVSDVEMPRMDGFDLTARVRADKQLAELPVVLVTALESREHRERGIDVGANAYIVKSSFDQSNLLEVVRRLT